MHMVPYLCLTALTVFSKAVNALVHKDIKAKSGRKNVQNFVACILTNSKKVRSY